MLFSVIAIFLKWVIIKIVLSGCNYSNCNITMHFSGIAIFLNWVTDALAPCRQRFTLNYGPITKEL